MLYSLAVIFNFVYVSYLELHVKRGGHDGFIGPELTSESVYFPLNLHNHINTLYLTFIKRALVTTSIKP